MCIFSYTIQYNRIKWNGVQTKILVVKKHNSQYRPITKYQKQSDYLWDRLETIPLPLSTSSYYNENLLYKQPHLTKVMCN